MEATARARADSDPSLGMFDCNTKGEITFVSDTFARWVNMDTEDLHGWKFLNIFHPLAVEGFRAGFLAAIPDGRKYTASHMEIIPTDRPNFFADIMIQPAEENGRVLRWVGVIRKEEHAS